jgi:PAS domain S-box-containing protein
LNDQGSRFRHAFALSFETGFSWARERVSHDMGDYRTLGALILILVLLFAVVISAGVYYFENERPRNHEAAASQLAYPLVASEMPWSPADKVDSWEAYAASQGWFWVSAVLACAMLGFAGATWWNYRKRRANALFFCEKLDLDRKFHSILDQTYEFIGLLTPDGTLVDANRSALRLSGMKESEVLGKPFWETPWWTHSREMQAKLRKGIKAAVHGEFVRFEATHRAADGKIHYVDFSLTPVKDESGKVIFLIPEGRDITDCKRREEAMELAQEWQRTFDSIPDLIALIDADYRIFRVNRAMADRLGCKPEELIGIHCCEAMHGLPNPPENCPHQKMMISKKKEQGEFYVDRLTGFFEITASPLLNEAGDLVGSVHIARDVTKRKQAESQLLEMNRHLEEATAHANELAVRAEESSMAKSDFLAHMSHELRTPLNAIIGFSEGMLERTEIHPLNEHQKDRLEKIKSSGQHLLEIINGVLNIAKAESGKIELQLSTFAVEEVVLEVKDMAVALTKHKSEVRVVIEMEEHLPLMYSDREKIRQILLNLLGNAVKFTARGTITLRVKHRDGLLTFDVQDTGVGISAENLDRLFDKYFQIERYANASLSGTGLGLAISKSFATLLGGSLTVKSVLGEGSVFTLEAPQDYNHRDALERPGKADKSNDPLESGSHDHDSRRILCIGSNSASVLLMNESLTSAGYRVVHASNGTKGTQLAMTETFAAVVLDTMLPGGEGWKTLYHLKSDPATGHVPVIVAANLDDKEMAQFLGANACLVKPVGKIRLLQSVESVTGDFHRHVRNVAVVDDDPNLLRLVKRILEKVNFEVWTYESGRAFLESLQKRRPDAVVLDLLMPHVDGFQVIETLHKTPMDSDIPVIVMTAKILEECESSKLKDRVRAVIQKEGTACDDTIRRLIDQLRLIEIKKEHELFAIP